MDAKQDSSSGNENITPEQRKIVVEGIHLLRVVCGGPHMPQNLAEDYADQFIALMHRLDEID